jgi:heme exporter protein D
MKSQMNVNWMTSNLRHKKSLRQYERKQKQKQKPKTKKTNKPTKP